MKEKLFLILKENESGQYLDGFDGKDYEWTEQRSRALYFKAGPLLYRTLTQVRRAHPVALIVPR